MNQTNEIFKAYDIRGDYPIQITEDTAFNLGKALVTFFKSDKILVGRDCRNGSKELATALMNGITEQGATAVDLGLCSTPMIKFASKDADAVMITASHLPPHKNGFKILEKGVVPISEANGLLDIKKIFEKNKYVPAKQPGNVERGDALKEYLDYVLRLAKNVKKLTVVVDAGNGMAGFTTPSLFQHLPCNLIRVFFELDNSFPNRSPDPTKEGSLKTLSETVVRMNANLGAAYDVDADRIIFVDETGKVVQPDISFALLIQHLLGRKKEAIIYDHTCSMLIPETIKLCKGTAVVSRTGHPFIQQIMRAKKAILGGERSGHYYFRELLFSDSADAALVTMLALLSKAGKPLSELVAPLKKYHSLQETFNVSDAEAFIAEITAAYKHGTLTKIDGITFTFSNWWFNVRSSNTEPIVKLTIEARSKPLLDQKLKELMKIVQKYS